jgi:uncharacterized repeat protein (TIGR02543 family)
MQSSEVEYGILPVYNGATPTKAADAEYTYTFKEWSPAIATVTGSATYTATFTATPNNYTLAWVANGGELSGEYTDGTTAFGTTIVAPTATRTGYTFAGWSQDVPATMPAEDLELTAQWTINKYTITFMNGEVELQSSEVEYGEMPVYTGETPTKEATAQYTYTFDGWSPEVVAVTGDAVYMAQFEATVKSYTITWLMDDDTEIDQTVVEYGQTPSHDDPIKEATAEWTYTFTGWDAEIVAVTGEATYKATFSATKRSYVITFEDEDGTELSAMAWEYGVMPECEEPTKDADDEYTYTFIGWTPAVEIVTGEATYIATYEATPKPHDPTGIGDVQGDKVQCTKVLIDDHIYIIRPDGMMYDLRGQRVQ